MGHGVQHSVELLLNLLHTGKENGRDRDFSGGSADDQLRLTWELVTVFI